MTSERWAWTTLNANRPSILFFLNSSYYYYYFKLKYFLSVFHRLCVSCSVPTMNESSTHRIIVESYFKKGTQRNWGVGGKKIKIDTRGGKPQQTRPYLLLICYVYVIIFIIYSLCFSTSDILSLSFPFRQRVFRNDQVYKYVDQHICVNSSRPLNELADFKPVLRLEGISK